MSKRFQNRLARVLDDILMYDVGIELPPGGATKLAGELIAHSDELWLDVPPGGPPAGEQLLFCGPKGAVFLGKATGDPNAMLPDGCIWVESHNGMRKARLWMEAPKGKAAEG